MIVGNGDFINLSGDESKALMFQNMLSESTVSDVYKLANVPEGTYISGVEFDESTNTFTFTFSNGTEFTAKVNSSGDVDLSEYARKDEVDSRIESIIGSAPEALDTLQELSKALGDDPNFATTVTEMISEVEKKTEEIKSSIPSIDGLATKEEVKEVQDSIPNLDEYVTNEQLESKGYLTEHQDISGLATKEELQSEATIARAAEKANSDAILLKADKTEVALKANQSDVDFQVNAINEVTSKLRTDVDYCGQRIDEDLENTSTALASKVSWDESKSKIILPSGGQLVGTKYGADGSDLEDGAVIAQLNKWDVMDFGSTKYPLNLNVPSGVRPTVQEKGQSGEEANEVAYLSDLSSISTLQSMMQVLEEKVNSLSKINTEIVVISEDSEDLIDDTKDYNISGSVSSTLNITGSSITINNLEVSNDARLKLIAKDVDSKGMSISGSFPKTNGNTVVSVNNSDYVIFRDLVFNATEVYNGIEIGLNSTNLPKNVIFDNCKFLGNFSNNAILIFGTQNNAVINISNCYFEHVSNCIRLSNKSNSTCTVNITNCKCDHWDTDPLWSGMLICQDYTSGSAEDEVTNNLFASSKITINVSNFVTPSGKKLTAPDDMSTICGSGDENQVFYVWSNYSNTTPYGDGSRYPTINIL